MSQVGTRLAEYGKKLFGDQRGWKTRYAEALGISLSALSEYINGQANPGNKVYAAFDKLGGDVEWLLTGKTADERTGLDINDLRDRQLEDCLKRMAVVKSLVSDEFWQVVEDRMRESPKGQPGQRKPAEKP